jgi:hypothetical protein
MIAVEHDLAFESTRQIETFSEHISRIEIPFARIAITVVNVLIAITPIVWVAIRMYLMREVHPRHLDVADVIVSLTRIEVEHRVLDRLVGGRIRSNDPIMKTDRIRGNSRSAGVGLSEVECVPYQAAITQAIVAPCSGPSRRGRHCASSGYTSESPGILSVRSSSDRCTRRRSLSARSVSRSWGESRAAGSTHHILPGTACVPGMTPRLRSRPA